MPSKTWILGFLVFGAAIAAPGQTSRPDSVASPPRAAVDSRIDDLVFRKLAALGIPPSEVCSDEVFVRRAYLDVIGTMPSIKEARAFLESAKPEKRRILIDELLARDEFANYWAMKWCELLRVKAEFPSDLWPNAVQAYHEWIRAALKQNLPYDRFARELLTSSGSNFRVPQVNFYRVFPRNDPQKVLQGVALVFMGTRTANWSEAQRLGMAAFFAKLGYKGTAEWKEEIVYFDPHAGMTNAATGQVQAPIPLTGPAPALSPETDPRTAFADWLTASNNPWFARCMVNRTWSWLLGRGIIHEPDDIRPDNPPQNEELLAYLEGELIAHQYDLKHVFRLILNSRVYQLSAEPVAGNQADIANFSHYHIRRLDAEVMIDALCMITGTTENYSSQIPEPFTFIDGQRAITLADGSITSPFLEMFGRPPRDTGYESERNNDPSVAQRLQFLNSRQVLGKIQNGPLVRRMMNPGTDASKIRDLYLAVLSRPPNAEEDRIATAYLQGPGRDRKEAASDLAWALINTKEFQFRH